MEHLEMLIHQNHDGLPLIDKVEEVVFIFHLRRIESRNLQGLGELCFEVALGCSFTNFAKVVVSKSSTSSSIKSNSDSTTNSSGIHAKSNTTSNVNVGHGIKEKE